MRLRNVGLFIGVVLLSATMLAQGSPAPILRTCTLTTTGYCPSATGINVANQGIDTQNVYIIPIGTPGSITVVLEGSVKGDFTDVATCGTSSTTSANLLSCSGIYTAVRVHVSVLTGFTFVNLSYIGTSTVARQAGGAVTASGSPASGDCAYWAGAAALTGTANCTLDSNGNLTLNSITGTGADSHISLPSNTSHSFIQGDLVNNAGVPTWGTGSGTSSPIITKATENLILGFGTGGTTVAGGATSYMSPIGNPGTGGTQVQREISLPLSGTISQMHVALCTAQPSGGTLTLTFATGTYASTMNAQNLAVSIAASAPAGDYSDVNGAHAFTYTAGNGLVINAVNASGSTSGNVCSMTFLFNPS